MTFVDVDNLLPNKVHFVKGEEFNSEHPVGVVKVADINEAIKTTISNRCSDLLVKVIQDFGADSQCKMAIEEMSELTKELCKAFRGFPNNDAIAEEIADVKIMLKQLELIYDCADSVIKWEDYKLNRLKSIISKHDNKEEV